MSEITYRKNNDKRLFVSADYDLHQSFLRSIRGRYYKKRTGGPVWSIPIEKEEALKQYINKLKEESSDSESDLSDSSSIILDKEEESEKEESEKEESEKEESEKEESEKEESEKEESEKEESEKEESEKEESEKEESRIMKESSCNNSAYRKYKKYKERKKYKNDIPRELKNYYNKFSKKPSRNNRKIDTEYEELLRKYRKVRKKLGKLRSL